MHVMSVNIANREILATPNGPVETGIVKQPTSATVFVTESGIVGDAIVDTSVHGGADQAIYLYSQEDYDWWCKQLDRNIPPGMFGENLTLSTFGERPLNIGDRLHINNVVLEISAPRTPCFKLATRMGDPGFIKDFIEAARCGAYARVIEVGEITAGNEAILIKTALGFPTVTEVFLECHSKEHDLNVVKNALVSPLGKYHREIIQRIYEKIVLV